MSPEWKSGSGFRTPCAGSTALAAAAAVTERIRLTTDILLAPLHENTALFAKQAATIHHLSGGRLVLGLGIGARTDDYELSAWTSTGAAGSSTSSWSG